MKIEQMEYEPCPCPVCGVDRCELCHVCTARNDGDPVLVEDCMCEDEVEQE